MRVACIVGARPQIIKHAALYPALKREHEVITVHSGQHYDYKMSGAFFDGFGLPVPDYNLNVGSGSHAYQTGRIMERVERVLLDDAPDIVVLYGDTNTTLAAALAAAKLNIPVCHVEAGVRSGDMRMPEEVNRIVTDRLAEVLCCPTESSYNTASEEMQGDAVSAWTGDLMAELLFDNLKKIPAYSGHGNPYYLLTVHRPENTDNCNRLKTILRAALEFDGDVIMPVHPRIRDIVGALPGRYKDRIYFIEPVPYLEMLGLIARSRHVVTDSGGVQKEAFLLNVPCTTLRETTEWPETLADGRNVLAGSSSTGILASVNRVPPCTVPKNPFFPSGPFVTARPSENIVRVLEIWHGVR